MKFTWDDKKARLNLKKHGIPFDQATSIFFDSFAGTIPDPDHSIGEHRFLTFGQAADGRLIVVSHTDEGDVIRIISAREANRNERKSYEG
ncbi:MAG: hypothetical protein FD130_513 [Halothiobacillaceae bacterium]|nr:MAG: hypothetical protein FD130_513 [Halothiobacillaceae bacterium]